MPQDLTELFIALSIFVLSAELAKNEMNRDTLNNPVGLIQKHIFWVCCAFGLLHGLGFAGALQDIGLPQEEVLTALLMFNVGVAIGQLFFLSLVIVIGIGIGMIAIVCSSFSVICP